MFWSLLNRDASTGWKPHTLYSSSFSFHFSIWFISSRALAIFFFKSSGKGDIHLLTQHSRHRITQNFFGLFCFVWILPGYELCNFICIVKKSFGIQFVFRGKFALDSKFWLKDRRACWQHVQTDGVYVWCIYSASRLIWTTFCSGDSFQLFVQRLLPCGDREHFQSFCFWNWDPNTWHSRDDHQWRTIYIYEHSRHRATSL